jgi:ring-1,2-phenylacetyl-CoA epoxidase subunit PaaA
MLTLAKGTKAQKDMAQRALNRWWWPSVMMFGPSDADSTNTEDSVRWKIKRYTNDELRQKFVDAIVPQAEKIGLTIPDKDLKWDKKRNEGAGGMLMEKLTGMSSGELLKAMAL